MANNNNKPRRSLADYLGGFYGQYRGFNPLQSLKGFGRDFRTAAGIPQDAKLWTKGGGIQLGNLPTVQNTYSLAPGTGSLMAEVPDFAYSFAKDSPYAALNGTKIKDVAESLLKDNTGASLGADKMDALVKAGDVNITGTNTVPGNGVSLGTLSNIASGIYQGGKAVKGIYDNINLDSDYSSLKDDINLSMAANPMYDMYLTAEDEKILRQMRNNTDKNAFGNVADGVVQGIPQAALSALMGGVTGGIPGAIIGGAGSLINSGVSGYGKGTTEAATKLQGVYDKLKQAEEDYRTMKRPRNLSRAGLSSRYFNDLY